MNAAGRAAGRVLCAAFAVFALAAAAPADELRAAQRSYGERGDYASLRVIAKHLRTGMTRNEVHALLGEPGLEFFESDVYSSDRDEYSKDNGVMMHKVLNVEYSMKGAKLTQRVVAWGFDLIGE